MSILDRFLILLNSSLGRDQCARVLQYGSKIADDVLCSMLPHSELQMELVNRVRIFGGAVAVARKVARFWRPLTGYLALVRYVVKLLQICQRQTYGMVSFLTMETSHDWSWSSEFLRILEQFCLANYMLWDHLNWAGRMGLLSDEQLEKAHGFSFVFNNAKTAQYNITSSKFWLLAAFFGLIATCIEMYKKRQELLAKQMELKQQQQQQQLQLQESLSNNNNINMSDDRFRIHGSEEDNKSKQWFLQVEKLLKEEEQLIRKAVIALCDIGVAANFSGYWKTAEWRVGLCGVIPAILIIYDLWPQ
jgi:hypothetical protein